MKLSKIVIATIAVCGASQVMAAGVTRLTGSSASSINVVRGLANACTTAGGTITVYKTTTSTSALGNQFSVKCSTAVAGGTPVDFDATSVDEARINVAGGSESAVTNAALFPTSTNTSFLVPTGACTAVAAGTEALSFLAAGQMRSCGTTLADSAKSDGGYLDVEGPVFNATKYDGGEFQPTGFNQVFGIAVNSTLYNALQAYQKTVAGGNIVAAACAAGATTPECQPSISRAQITSLINNDLFNAGKTSGGAYLVPGSAVSKITYCQRPQTSGTQQSAQLYFLGSALNGSLGGAEVIVPNNTSLTKYSSILNNGSSDVKTCLNSATDFRFGGLSLENNPLGGSDTYRFVKLNEVAATEGVAGASQTTTAIAGRYDFVYELSAYCPGGTCADIIATINSAVTAGASSPGIFLGNGVESKFGRNGNSASPVASH